MGKILLGLLLVSPLLFKVQLTEGIVVHPVVSILALAWIWVAVKVRRALRQKANEPSLKEEQSLVIPLSLFLAMVGGLAVSLALNTWRFPVNHAASWLLLLKLGLYVAPLPFVAMLTRRLGLWPLRLASWMIPSVAALTALYSLYTLSPYLGTPVTDGIWLLYSATGLFSEMWTPHGLMSRTDTVAKGAYGVYMVFALVFSLTLRLFAGFGGRVVPEWYARGQAVVVGPLALFGILWSGSRASGLLLLGSAVCFAGLLLWNPARLMGPRRKWTFLCGMVLVGMSLVFLPSQWKASIPLLEMMTQTVQHRGDLSDRQSLAVPESGETHQAVQNVHTRLRLWRATWQYLVEHPLTAFIGIGYDRVRYVEEVLRLPYEGVNVQYQTAHNVFLDLWIKGGLVPVIALVLLCGWVLWNALIWLVAPATHQEQAALKGMGWLLLAFWPPFILGVNLTGEEMLTDNALLHWTTVWGLGLGLWERYLRTTARTHLIHVTASAAVGGGPAYVTALVRHQLAGGKRVRIVCSDERPYVQVWQNMGVGVTTLPLRRFSLLTVWRLVLVLLEKPGMLYAHGRGAACFTVWAKILLSLPGLYIPNGPHYIGDIGASRARGAIAWALEYLFLKTFDVVIYVSQGEREVTRQYHLPVLRSHVIVSGFLGSLRQEPATAEEQQTVRHTLRIPMDGFVIGWIGRVCYQKGLDVLLNSIVEVGRQVPHAHWVVVGDGRQPDIENWRKQIAGDGLAERVHWLGEVMNAYSIIPAFDILVSTSRWEGLPFTLLEAMDQGIAIAASDVVGNRDVLDGWGLLFAPENPVACAAAQVKLAEESEFRSRLATTGREIVRQRYRLDRMLSEMDTVYQALKGRAPH